MWVDPRDCREVRNRKTSKIFKDHSSHIFHHIFTCFFWFLEVESRWCCGGTHPHQFGLSGFEQAKYATKWGMSDAMLKISDFSPGCPQIIWMLLYDVFQMFVSLHMWCKVFRRASGMLSLFGQNSMMSVCFPEREMMQWQWEEYVSDWTCLCSLICFASIFMLCIFTADGYSLI